MLYIVILAYKPGQKAKQSRRNQYENGQITYHVLMNIQGGRRIDQIYGDPS